MKVTMEKLRTWWSEDGMWHDWDSFGMSLAGGGIGAFIGVLLVAVILK